MNNPCKAFVMELPPPVDRVLRQLNTRGYEAYLVGGCVRDALMGAIPHDYDVTTSAMPDEVMALFAQDSRFYVIGTGLQHGTVTVVRDGMSIEVTTYRVDGAYSDHRRPDSVQFTRLLREDLARRDFTVNAMAYHPQSGLVDAFGGYEDIQARVIRAVGSPSVRFDEDALRILRGLRFASQLAFTIEEQTGHAMKQQCTLLRSVSAERIAVELMKLLTGPAAADVLHMWAEVLYAVLPELAPMKGFAQNTPYHHLDVWQHSLLALRHVPPVPALRLAALLHDAGKPQSYTEDAQGVGHFYGHAKGSGELALGICRRLKLDNATTERVCTLIADHDKPIEPTEKSIKRWLNRLGTEPFFDLLYLKAADCHALNPKHPDYDKRQEEIEGIRRLALDILEQGACFSLKSLAINGNDLRNIGFPEGKAIGVTLQTVLQKVMDGELDNTADTLLAYAQQHRDAYQKPCEEEPS